MFNGPTYCPFASPISRVIGCETCAYRIQIQPCKDNKELLFVY